MSTDNGYAIGDHHHDHGRCLMVDSPALGKQMPVLVFEPDGPAAPDQRWPVCYVLHGVNKQPLSEEGLRALYHPGTGLAELANRYRCLIVCPITGSTFYIDSPVEEQDRFASYVGIDLPAAIDVALPTLADREHRWLMGFSMGGHGAVTMLCRNPDTFSAAASRGGVLDLATGVKDLHWDDANAVSVLGSYWHHPDRFHHNSALNLVNHIRDRGDCSLVIDVGVDDFLIHCNRRFRDHLLRIGMDHIYTETPGGHSIAANDFRRMFAALHGLISDRS